MFRSGLASAGSELAEIRFYHLSRALPPPCKKTRHQLGHRFIVCSSSWTSEADPTGARVGHDYDGRHQQRRGLVQQLHRQRACKAAEQPLRLSDAEVLVLAVRVAVLGRVAGRSGGASLGVGLPVEAEPRLAGCRVGTSGSSSALLSPQAIIGRSGTKKLCETSTALSTPRRWKRTVDINRRSDQKSGVLRGRLS